jgi:hypothetical protein
VENPDADAVAMMRQLVEETNKTLASHKLATAAVNENLAAAHKSMQRQAEEIVASREIIIKLWQKVFGDVPPPPQAIN